ncbi:MAG: helix-turn-helix transcriptional regulator [Silicimonas sp.]|nr:helix-turn-helix transcriptional regulator [Silicimonas sp.]
MSVSIDQLASTAIRSTDLKMLDGIAGWCGGLHGSMALAETLGALANGCGASAAAIARHHRGEHLPRTVAVFDSKSRAEDLPTLQRPLARDAMGYMYKKAKPATVWFLTDLLDDAAWSGTQMLTNWKMSREISEIVVISLGGAQNRDYVEFHFEEHLQYSEKLEFEALTPTIVRSWAGRKKGLVTETLMGGRRRPATAAAQKSVFLDPILSMANPANLSRAEFRVCLMLSKGLSVKGVVEELGTSEATVRSHLRSIYQKTDAQGMAELLYKILAKDAQANELKARSA